MRYAYSGGLLPCRPDRMEEVIKDILSSPRSHWWRQGYCHIGEGPKGAAPATPWPSCQTRSHSQSQVRDYPHDKALQKAREAHWQALEAACMLELNIDRLIQEVDGIPHQCPCSCSQHQGRSLDRHERSLSQHRLERHVTFCDPEGMPWAKGCTENPEGIRPEHN